MTSSQPTLTIRSLSVRALCVASILISIAPPTMAQSTIAKLPSTSLGETITDLLSDLKLNTSRTNRRQKVETRNFRVYCVASAVDAQAVAQACESLRELLSATWLGTGELERWTVKCDIVLHPTSAEYHGALGRGSEQSSGCSSIYHDRGQIISRRIDICALSASQTIEVLPHEMTHIILADVFPSAPPPRWAAEGMAILAEPHRKQQMRLSGLTSQVSSHNRVLSLLGSIDYPTMDSRGSFYAQSALLVKFLAMRESPERFVRFIQQAEREGYEKALRDAYQIEGVAHLDRIWRTPSRPPIRLVPNAASAG